MSSQDSRRWFFCLPLEKPDQASFARLQCVCSPAALRPTDCRWAHVTLRFCGPLPPEASGQLIDAFPLVPLPGPFVLRGEGDVVLMGADAWSLKLDCPPQLTECVRFAAEVCRRAGLAPERRPFVPHITIGRRRGRVNAALFQPFERWSFSVEAVQLRTSTLTPQGARYQILASRSLPAAPQSQEEGNS